MVQSSQTNKEKVRMKISTLKQVIRLAGAAKVALFIWGHRGIGKSSVVKQVSKEDGKGCIDMRCSQLEASDLRGLPDKGNGRTVYLPPSDMPIGDMKWTEFLKRLGEKPEQEQESFFNQMQPHMEGGILFLDELN